MIISGKESNSGGFVNVPDGTYEVTVGDPAAERIGSLYYNASYESLTGGHPEARDIVQLDLIYDPDMIGENDDGEEVDLAIFDTFLRVSMNERANLVKRLKSIDPGFDPRTAELEIVFADAAAFANGTSPADHEIPHRIDNRLDIADILLNGESLKGRSLVVTVAENAKGYMKVENTSPVVTKPAKRKSRKPADLPA